MTDLEALARGAEPILARAGETLMAMRRAGIDATRKEGLDVVTAADLASERVVIEGLRALSPSASILSEEAGAIDGSGDARWIIDPLDGTVNFAAGLPWFSVTIAYQERGETLLGMTRAPAMPLAATWTKGGRAEVDGAPARVSPVSRLADAVVSIVITSHFDAATISRAVAIVDRLSRRTRGVRIVVSGALEMSLVAAGRMDAFVHVKADVVSHAAAMPLVRAAGGRVTTMSGADAVVDDLERVASNGLVHDELLDAIAGS